MTCRTGPAVIEAEIEEPIVVAMNDVVEEPLVWLWNKRMPLGMPSLLEGDPGTGKSLIQLAVAARLTRGEPLPFDAEGKPHANVLILSSEDDAARTIRPRLRVLGADLARIRFCTGIRRKNGRMRLPKFPSDLDWLRKEVIAHSTALVLIDPLTSFTDPGLSANRETDMRMLFFELQDLCRQTGVTLSVLRHLNKVEGANSLYRGSGSVSIIAAVRAGLLVARDPTRPDENNVFILAVNKANLAAPCQSIRYRIVDEGGIGRIEFLELVDMDARQLVAAGYKQTSDAAQAAEATQAPAFAIQFLQQALDKGPRRIKELKELAAAAGIAWSSVLHARNELLIESHKEDFGGAWLWELVRLPADLLKQEPTSGTP